MLSRVQLFVTPWTSAYQAPLSLGILQAKILEWVAVPSSRESSQPRDQTQVSHVADRSITNWTTKKAQEWQYRWTLLKCKYNPAITRKKQVYKSVD